MREGRREGTCFVILAAHRDLRLPIAFFPPSPTLTLLSVWPTTDGSGSNEDDDDDVLDWGIGEGEGGETDSACSFTEGRKKASNCNIRLARYPINSICTAER